MNTAHEQSFLYIVGIASRELGVDFKTASLAWISQPRDAGVADAPTIFRISAARSEDDAVFIVSNERFPEFVANAVECARTVRDRVQQSAGGRVLLPKMVGRHGDRSFAVYRRLYPVSENRWLSKAQRILIEPGVCAWLRDVAVASRTVPDAGQFESAFVRPLTFVAAEAAFSGALRGAAETALRSLERGTVAPVTTVQHGDFWIGNILLNRVLPLPRSGSRFFVIDWGSANLQGYPFVDLVRYIGSTSSNRQKLRRRVEEYRRQCGFEREALSTSICASIGWIGRHRNEFPLEQYIASSEALFRRADGLLT